MGQRTQFITYLPKHILNKGKRADHWFWARYGAYPYMGCQHGCAFCYCREKKFIPYKPQDSSAVYDAELDQFSHFIKIKENAPILLRKALSRLPVDVVFTGDYQAVERKYKISRQMLEVCLELGFPVFVLTRSPLVSRDIDLFQSINHTASVVVAFSIVTTPESKHYDTVSRLENLAPNAEKRFKAMAELAKAGILTGTVAMPLLPGLCDNDKNLTSLAHWTADHGGKFVLGGGLTLADQQKEFFMGALGRVQPDLLPLYQKIYPPGSYGQTRPWREVGIRLREHCQEVGITDRIPRPIIAGEKRAFNKRVVEKLANQCYTLELKNAPSQQVWAYRNAAWAVEDLEQNISLIYRSMGIKGLEAIPKVNKSIALEIEALLNPNDPSHFGI